jgi:hypothetical protein
MNALTAHGLCLVSVCRCCILCAAGYIGPPPQSQAALIASASPLALVVGSRLFAGAHASERGWKSLEATVDA